MYLSLTGKSRALRLAGSRNSDVVVRDLAPSFHFTLSPLGFILWAGVLQVLSNMAARNKASHPTV